MTTSQVLRRSAALALLAGITLGGTAFAQAPNAASLQDRIEALQRQVAQLEEALRRGTPAPATATPNGDSAKTIEERLDDLSQQIRVLARQVEIDKEAAAERAKTVPQIAAGRSGFTLQSADGQFRLRLRGYVQADSRLYEEDTESRGVDSFLLRRVRPIVEATVFGNFDVRVMPDFAGGTTVLQDAYIDARLHPAFKVRAGKFKPPVGFERLVSATELLFIERAFPTALVPNRDLGLMVYGDLARGNISYAGGGFNGVVDGGSADADTDDSKDVAGRLFFQPFRQRRDSALKNLGFGVSGSYGDQHATTAAASGLPTIRTAGQVAFFAHAGDDPTLGPVVADGTHTRLSAHGHYYVGQLGLLAEHVRSSQDVRRKTTTATLDKTAWQIAGSWVLTGETPSYRGVTPLGPFDRKAGTWGAIELTARYSAIDLDPDTFPIFANPATASQGADAWLAGVNWYLNSGVKIQANFERTTFEPAGTVRRSAENMLLTRLQLVF